MSEQNKPILDKGKGKGKKPSRFLQPPQHYSKGTNKRKQNFDVAATTATTTTTTPTATTTAEKKRKELKKTQPPTNDDDIVYTESEPSSDEDQPEEGEGENDDEEEDEIINIDFEFFDPRESDFHTVKNLLGALFDSDAENFFLSELADMIVKQPLLGSTVKINGIDSDPFALLTVLNMNEHKEKTVIGQIRSYVLDKIRPAEPEFHAALSKLLAADCSEKKNVGLLITERLVNMPAQIAPPMFKMLCDEVQWALEENEPYNFTHYLLLSKTYRTVKSNLVETKDGDGDVVVTEQKTRKKPQSTTFDWGKDMFYYHPEHEVIEQFAEYSCPFSYTHATSKTVADAKRAFHEFGIIPSLKAFLIPADKLPAVIEAMEKIIAG